MAGSAEEAMLFTQRFRQWDDAVVQLTASTDLANARMRAAQDLLMKELRASRDAAGRALREFTVAEGDAANRLRSEMELACESMEQTLARVRPGMNALTGPHSSE
jgi:hypothetical protein